MGNIREEYKVKKEDKEKNKPKTENKRREYDPLAFPFGTDEALLLGELKELNKEPDKEPDER